MPPHQVIDSLSHKVESQEIGRHRAEKMIKYEQPLFATSPTEEDGFAAFQSSVAVRGLHLRYKSKRFLSILFCSIILLFIFLQQSQNIGWSQGKGWMMVRKRVNLPFHMDKGLPFTSPQSSNVNSTLGFQNIFVINLEERQDKKDYISLMAHSSGLKVNFMEGIHIDNKTSLPDHGKVVTGGRLGGFRSHANIWRKMILEDITTALILEDDADWNINIKYQMANLQRSLATLIPSERDDNAATSKKNSSLDWDILRLGYCYDHPMTETNHPPGINGQQLPYISYPDVGLPLENQCWPEQDAVMKAYNAPLKLGQSPRYSGRRIVSRSNVPVCLHAYALSKQGAFKLLFNHNHQGLPISNDIAFLTATRNGFMKSYSVIPTLFTQFQASRGRDSDIEEIHTIAPSISPFLGFSPCITESVRSGLIDLTVPK